MPVQSLSKETEKYYRRINRPNDIIWVVSSCQIATSSASYVAAMKRYTNLQIDIYGKCQKKQLPVRYSAVAELMQTYKFYLSFEKIICRGLITERFFKALGDDIIPVVRGSRLG